MHEVRNLKSTTKEKKGSKGKVGTIGSVLMVSLIRAMNTKVILNSFKNFDMEV